MSSAVKKMEQEAEKEGYRNLIKAMNKLTGDKPKAKAKAKAKVETKKEDKENKEIKVDDDLKNVIRGFFKKKKNDDKKVSADLYVGNATKKYGKPKPKPRPKPKPKKYGR